MSANNQSQEFFETLRSIAGPVELRSLALTVARMIAAAKLAPSARDDAPGFLDQGRELTRADWLAIVAVLAKRWEPIGDRSANPFENPLEDPPLTPGGLERLRELILSYLSQNGLKACAVPSWLLHGTLELLDPHDLFGRAPKGADSRLRDLVVEAVDATAKTRVFCAYDGATGVALELAKAGADVTLDIQQADLAAICRCLGLAAELRMRVRQGDPIELARYDVSTPLLAEATFDTSIVFPPFGARHSWKGSDSLGTGLTAAPSSEAAGVTLALARGRDIALCVLPPSFLFQTTKVDQVFKEQVIQKFGLNTIVGLPRGMIGGTSIAAALVAFKPKDKRSQPANVFMIDARGFWDQSVLEATRSHDLADLMANHETTEISLTVPINELAANDFNLSVERYVLDPEARRLRELTADQSTIQLSEVAELHRPQAIPQVKGNTQISQVSVSEVGVADIDAAGVVRSPSKQIAVAPDATPQVRKARLESGDVLLVIKGSLGKVGFIRDIPTDEVWIASQSFTILRLRQHAPLSDPRILFRFLSSSLGQASIHSLRVGVAVPGLQMADVRRLPLVVPDKEAHSKIAHEVDGLFALQDQIVKLRAGLAEQQARIWPENLKNVSRPLSSGETASARKPSSKKRTS